MKITNPDKINLDEKALANLFLHSLFSRMYESLNKRDISSANNTYPYYEYIESLLNNGENAKKSLLSYECF